MLRLLHCFGLVSGLKPNLSKINLFGIGVLKSEVEQVAKTLGCAAGSTPFMYLGLPVGARMDLLKSWDDVTGKIKASLSSWHVKNLSIGGRLTLLKFVSGSLPSYYFLLFRVPARLNQTLESLRSNFF